MIRAFLTYGYFVYDKMNHTIEILVMIMILLIIIVCVLVYAWHKNRIISIELDKELEAERLYVQSFEALITNIRRRQHEFDNHINTLRGLQITHKSYEELVSAQNQYCGQIEEREKFSRLLLGGNPIIDGYLYAKFAEIDAMGIDIIYHIRFDKIEGDIPDFKIIEILGNLIDNAIEAMQGFEDKDRKLLVNIIKKDRTEIEVRNKSPYISIEESKTFFKKGYSTKGSARGLGLYNVKQLCKQYHIDILCDNVTLEEENWFGFSLVIK